MLVIKLSKTGKTNKKMFRLIVLEKGRDPYGDFLENLGFYNPHSKELVAKGERIKYWLSKGAQMTKTINNLLVGGKIIDGQKIVVTRVNKTSEKRLAQTKAKSDKKASKATETKVEASPEKTAEPLAPAETPVEQA